jgi:hypothetical protein
MEGLISEFKKNLNIENNSDINLDDFDIIFDDDIPEDRRHLIRTKKINNNFFEDIKKDNLNN